MKINPMNVLNLLVNVFEVMNIPASALNDDEFNLKEKFEQILIDGMTSFNGIEIIEEEVLEFENQINTIEDVEENVNEGERNTNETASEESAEEYLVDAEVSIDYKSKAVNYWTSGKVKRLKVATVKNRFKKVTSKTQLYRWEQQILNRGTNREKLNDICASTIANFATAVNAGKIVHDIDIQKWAVQAKLDYKYEDVQFKASRGWLHNFKKNHRIVSRKINKFVTKNSLENNESLRKEATNFTNSVLPFIEEYGLRNVYNSDQSGFQLEIHSGRSLAVRGDTKIKRLVQSISATTHSYTIQPTISGDGKLLSPLFIVLKEPTGKFGPHVKKNMFKAKNVYVLASKSGKLTSEHFKTWFEEVFVPNVEINTQLIVDSWSGHSQQVIREMLRKTDKNITVKIIPKGTTGEIQPLDVFTFRFWKNFVKTFSDRILLLNYGINLHLRDNIIKLQSLTHQQLCSPRYVNLFRYAWFKSGYTDLRPDKCDNPVEFGFQQSCSLSCEIVIKSHLLDVLGAKKLCALIISLMNTIFVNFSMNKNYVYTYLDLLFLKFYEFFIIIYLICQK